VLSVRGAVSINTSVTLKFSGGGDTVEIVSYVLFSRRASLLHTAIMHIGRVAINRLRGLESTQTEEVKARMTVSVEQLSAEGGMLTKTKVQ